MDVLILAILFVGSALLLGYFRSPSYKGAVGERRVSSMFHRKLNQNYFIFNDVLLPTSNGTTQIDHLIVSIINNFEITSWEDLLRKGHMVEMFAQGNGVNTLRDIVL